MTANRSFLIFLACILSISLTIKLVTGGRITDPPGEIVLQSIEFDLVQQGFSSAGQTSIAGRKAVLVGRGDCLSYIVPVAPQGWHQQTLRTLISPEQHLWFSFAGNITSERQPTLSPLAKYYTWKTLSYLGMRSSYHPVLAIVATSACDLSEPFWSKLSMLPFEQLYKNSQN